VKTKLTLTIDAQLIPKAKRYARARGVSLSSVVEEALQRFASDESPSFVERWRGRFEAASKNDDRFQALAEKYL
jgi:post-segregation antitoxin (ccd killing protein)